MNSTQIGFRKIAMIVVVIIFIGSSNLLYSQSTAIFLKNGKTIDGKIVEENNNHIIIANDIGEVKIRRNEIEKIYYGQFPNGSTIADSLLRKPLNDHVVVHLKNGEVVDGLLIAKSPTMVMVQNDVGRFTVPKQDVKLVEYVSEAFAERGEAITVELTSGKKLEGYLYHEDRNSLSVTTAMGRLSINKTDLRSIEYHASIKFPRPGSKKQDYLSTQAISPLKAIALHQRQDTFESGISSQLGENYSLGGVFGYRNRYNLKSYQSFSLNFEGNFNIAAFSLNKNIISEATLPGQIEASGAAVVTSLGAGVPIHLYPTEGSAYEFYITPALESHIVYKTLTKTYPSYPSLDSETRSTDFRFGLGSRVGMEWSFGDKWRAGISFNMHFILGDSDFNSFNLYLGTRLY